MDNLGAHGLAGFQEGFNVEKFCRFCLLSRDQRITIEARDFQLRPVEQHNTLLEDLKASNETHLNGVKRECVLSKHLSYLHPSVILTSILHEFFEGVIPLEISLCLKEFISKGFLTFDRLNNPIQSFPY